ncbi:MAG: heme-binding protein [Alphaproteobacteria bacterium]|nr:heme-binding protein [Alphaproteobacteria bacterium]
MHKLRTILIAAAAAGALIATGAVAASLDSLVIHGDAAKKIHEKYALSIDTAKKMSAACVAFAKQKNVAVSVAIMDPFGEMIYFERMDGQGKLNTSTAILKAKTALVTRASTHLVMNNVLQGNVSDFRAGYWNGEFANKGGLPIIAEDQFLGAIGVGGSNVDEECAQAALEAVVGPQPPLVQNLPRRPTAANGG